MTDYLFLGLVSCILIFLAIVVVALLTSRRTLRARDKLRWQIKTHRQLEKELSKGSVDIETADDIITHPSYGIKKDEQIDTSFAILDKKKWQDRMVAKKEWELEWFLISAVLLLFAVISGLIIISFGLYRYLNFMDLSQRDEINAVLLFALLRPLLLGIIFLSIRLNYVRSRMARYRYQVSVSHNLPEAELFVTLVSSPEHLEKAQLLIDSIRAFGGPLSRSPIWIFESDPQRAPCEYLRGDGIRVLPLNIPESVRGNYFAGKVYACAYAETWAEQRIKSLIWISPDCLVIKPPLLFDLGVDFDAALRPVHIKNVGLLVEDELDDFWKKIYKTVGVDDVQAAVDSFVGGRRIRAYYNSHAFAVNPAKRLLKRWFDCFEKLLLDDKFQQMMNNDQHIFLHQAVLSALLATQIIPDRVRILPPEYSYPYNLHGDVPDEWRAECLNDLVSIAYENRSLNPNLVTDINIDEPLRSWLSSGFDQN
ncbi:MAG: hypothetical protein H8D34_25595 [Chloroflexi bacterium]|nr:hypothetical protein [Chloroflexota bacterium]